MSLYLIIFLINTIFVYIADIGRVRFKLGNSIATKDQDDKFYIIILVIYGLMLICRYGQGADYFVYRDTYNAIDRITVRSSLFSLTGQEFGWVFINKIFSGLGFSFEAFVIVLSIFEILLLNRFVQSFMDKSKCFVLLILMPTFYFTYLFSTLRQGFVMCVFIGVMLPILQKRRYIPYIILCILLTSIHITSILYLFCLIIPVCKNIKTKTYEYIAIGAMIIGLSFHFFGLYTTIYNMLPATFHAHAGIDTSMGAIVKRIVLLIIVIYCSHRIEDDKEQIEYIYKLILLATVLYFMTSGISLLAGRAYALWGDALETIIIAKYVVSSRANLKLPITTIIVALSAFLLVKNINAEIYRSFYVDSINVMNFPYCNIFNKEMIDIYRTSHYYR